LQGRQRLANLFHELNETNAFRTNDLSIPGVPPPTWPDPNVYGLVFYPPLVGHSFSFGLMAYVLPTPGTMFQTVYLEKENRWHSLYQKKFLFICKSRYWKEKFNMKIFELKA
jgi:hypothetical protein